MTKVSKQSAQNHFLFLSPPQLDVLRTRCIVPVHSACILSAKDINPCLDTISTTGKVFFSVNYNLVEFILSML